jgi:HD-like signal output (HDOD) protein
MEHVPVEVEEQQAIERRCRLLDIIENGLPPFRHTVLELMEILNDPEADFKKAAKPICMDPVLGAQVLRTCNSPLFGRRTRVRSIEQAVTLLGADRLRSMAMTSTLVGFVGQGLREEQISSFWQHSFLCGMLSKHLARLGGYAEVEQAYIAGLLHDIGLIPQLMFVARHADKPDFDNFGVWIDLPTEEKRLFGVSHCELGHKIATTWGLMPSFVDIVLHHHTPADAEHDLYLVELVAQVEEFLIRRSLGESSGNETHSPLRDEHSSYDTLATEYEHLLPLVDQSLSAMIGSTESPGNKFG